MLTMPIWAFVLILLVVASVSASLGFITFAFMKISKESDGNNNATGKCSFIDDTSALTKKTKNELVRFFNKKENDKKHVAYLVVPKESKGGNYGKK